LFCPYLIVYSWKLIKFVEHITPIYIYSSSCKFTSYHRDNWHIFSKIKDFCCIMSLDPWLEKKLKLWPIISKKFLQSILNFKLLMSLHFFFCSHNYFGDYLGIGSSHKTQKYLYFTIFNWWPYVSFIKFNESDKTLKGTNTWL